MQSLWKKHVVFKLINIEMITGNDFRKISVLILTSNAASTLGPVSSH